MSNASGSRSLVTCNASRGMESLRKPGPAVACWAASATRCISGPLFEAFQAVSVSFFDVLRRFSMSFLGSQAFCRPFHRFSGLGVETEGISWTRMRSSGGVSP